MPISTAVDASAVARVVGIETQFRDLRAGGVLFLPQRIAVVGQGSADVVYPSTKFQATTAFQAGERFGFGSPVHLAALQLLPVNGDGVGSVPVTIYPLQADASGVAASGSVTIAGSQTEAAAYKIRVNNIESLGFVIAPGDSVTVAAAKAAAAVNGILAMPVKATAALGVVTLTAKWEGESSNDLHIEVEGSTTAGSSFAISQPSGGLLNPDVQPALDAVGTVWETLMLNTLNIDDSDALDAYATFGEGRWGALVRKPLIVFSGNNAAAVGDSIAIPEGRKTDRVNSQLVAPGSNDLPFVTAARQLARIARVANNSPSRDYGSQDATGLTAGADGQQWNYPQRDQAVKGGSSTVEVKDGVINLSDTVTMYHPTGDPIPAYRYVADIVKLQNIIFNLDLLFANADWDGAPLIPDDQPTVNRDAKKPRAAKAAVCAMIDSLGLNAIIADPAYSKSQTFAAINDQNPKRLDLTTTVKLSGNTNIISVDLNFGYFFGTSALVA